MKKLIFIASILMLGCSPGGDPFPQTQPQPRPTQLQLTFSKTSLQFGMAAGENTLDVESNLPWSARLIQPEGSSWLTFTPGSGEIGKTTMRIAVAANNSGSSRMATISFTAGEQTRSFSVTQPPSRPDGNYIDGEVVQIQSATTPTGRGIELVIMGDGFTLADMAHGGRYETVMRETAEHFFSTYPYSAHRGRFNVWMVVAISNQAGISVQNNPSITVDNKFKSWWEGGESTLVDCDEATVKRYASLVAARTGKLIDELTVVLPINVGIDAGTTIMQSGGFSYALCPMGPMYKNVVVHESGGHGFAKLGDEYAYNDTTVPSNRRAYIQEAKASYGWYENLDFSFDPAQTTWRGFVGNPKYSMVSTFEGGASYTRGIWRPEANSVMIGGVLYFNAPSRWAAMRRMNQLEGTPYTFAQFLVDDVVPVVPPQTPLPGSTLTRAGSAIRHAPPIVVTPQGRIQW